MQAAGRLPLEDGVREVISMSVFERFASEYIGSSGGSTPLSDPPVDPFDSPSGGSAPPSATHPRRGPRRLAIVATVVALVGMVGVLLLGPSTASAGSSTVLSGIAPIAAVSQPVTAIGGASVQAATVAANVGPALVDINTVVQTATGSGTAAGTGIILTSGGEVLTNNHVVQGATSITVQIAGRTGSYTASVIGVDPTADVALIQVNGVFGLPTATLADSSTLQAGESVVAIGNAGGVGGAPSVTQGTIVALGQSITATDGATSEQLTGMIQSDATIAPGDSGGAIVNSADQVVGMITAGQSTTRNGATEVGFAIPTDNALAGVNQIRAGQASSQVILGQVGYLGISVTDLTPSIAAQLGLSITSGAVVVGVISGSPADQAGLAQDAVITEVAGNPINSTTDLGNVLHSFKPGDQVQVTWTDQASTSHTVTITLTTGPAI
jgi:S1-C subfamily serine protease